ncbi:hypothetical protein ACLB2K_040173 [Fragaria x ananassa]
MSLWYKPHNSAACRSLTQEQILAQFGNPDFSETAMVCSQPTQDTGSAPPMERISQMFEQLTSKNLATQQSVVDLTEQVKQEKNLMQATHDKLAMLKKDYGHLDAKFTKTMGLVEGSLQRIRLDLDQNTETVKQHAEVMSLTRATVDEQTHRLDDHNTKLHNQQSAVA